MKLFVLALAVLASLVPRGQVESSMTRAAKAFMGSLTEDQLAQAVLPFDSPDKTTWTYVPGNRKGVSWADLSESQKALAKKLLTVSLSKEGYDKIEAIRSLEPVLAEMEGGNTSRDPNKYWFVFFGHPDQEAPWVWRYEGHHVSLTFANRGGLVVSSTPQFLGSNPAEVKSGPRKGLRVLAREQDLGFQLVESLSLEQRKKAIPSEAAPADIVTGSSRSAGIEGRLGIPYGELTDQQRVLLKALVVLHATVQTEAEQARRLEKIEDEGYDTIVFAWLGPVERHSRHYYRIQGRSFLIEYDNTQEDGNHIHTVWRDFKGDFGEDVLAEHYAHDHEAGAGHAEHKD